jgi:hypothetical protein
MAELTAKDVAPYLPELREAITALARELDAYQEVMRTVPWPPEPKDSGGNQSEQG